MLCIWRLICSQLWSAAQEQSIIRGQLGSSGSISVEIGESSAECIMSYQAATEAVPLGNDVCVYLMYYSTVNLILSINDKLA